MSSNFAIAEIQPLAANLREIQRKALFVAATIVVGDQVDPVRVRNMSAGGALLEGAVLPVPGTTFEVVRAHLSVGAKAMWTRGNQCGVSFCENVDVAEWMTPNSPTQQQRIDSMFHQARCQVAAVRKDRHDTAGSDEVPSADPVRMAIRMLVAMEEVFVIDPHIQMNHPAQMRALKKVLNLLRSPVAPASLT